MRHKIKRALYLLIAGVISVVGLSAVLPSSKVHAAELTQRSLLLEPGATAGGSAPGGVVNHQFTFTPPTSGTTINSISFTYCVQADSTCGDLATNNGLVLTNATIGTNTSSSLANLSTINTATADEIWIGDSGTNGYAPTNSSTPVTVEFDTITNPTTANFTFYVRIATYASNNATGTPIDSGNVAASTATPITLNGQMPESLVFCTGGAISETAGVPDCTTATSGAVDFLTLFSPTATSVATSQMAASTNASHGYAITATAPLLTSGSNTIADIGSTASGPVLGTPQFGMNLVLNTTATATPAPGANITPTSAAPNYYGEALAGFNTQDQYAFQDAPTVNNVADSANGGTPEPTDAQIYTSTYIVDVPGNQAPGAYTTTVTYICTPNF